MTLLVAALWSCIALEQATLRRAEKDARACLKTLQNLRERATPRRGTHSSVPPRNPRRELSPLTFLYSVLGSFLRLRRYAATGDSAPYTMSMRIFTPGAMFALAAVLIPAMAQEPAQQTKAKYVSLIGTVEKVDASGKTFSIKPDKPGDSEVKFDDKTQFLAASRRRAGCEKGVARPSHRRGSG